MQKGIQENDTMVGVSLPMLSKTWQEIELKQLYGADWVNVQPHSGAASECGGLLSAHEARRNLIRF